MKNYLYSFLLLGAIFIFGWATPVYAQTGLAQLAGCSGVDCTACNVVSMANGLITWLIGILFVIFAVLLAIAGVRLVASAGNHHALDEAKSTFTNAIIGFMIILAAWLIVDTIMRALVGTDGNPGQIVANGTASGYLFWSEVQCQEYIEPGYRSVTQEGVEWLQPDVPPPPASDPGGTPGTIPSGPGNNSIVSYAQQMDARQCQYSQGRRNNCSGNPGYTDCSELVHYAYLSAGCRSPGNFTGTIYGNATSIGSPSTLRTGDLIVVRANGSGHVVICMTNGCGSVIHARGRGAPDGQPATIPVADQITVSGGSYYYSQSIARVIRASSWCPTGAGPQ
ncbi:MAG: NlpC/P60 family protein [Patescibacteria group bacterium]